MQPFKDFGNVPLGYTFGVPTSYSDFHLGTDFIIKKGTPVFAVKSGIVTLNTLIDTGNMVTLWDGMHSFRYMHLSQFSVSNGQPVTEGRQIGLSGGHPGDPGAGESTGDHLHFDIYAGKPVNVHNRSGFIDPMKFDYQNNNITMHFTHAFKSPNSPDIYVIGKAESADELAKMGFDNSNIQTIEHAKLIKQTGADPVFMQFQNPTAGFEVPFTGGTVGVDEYNSIDLEVLNAPHPEPTPDLSGKVTELETKITNAQEALK